MSEVRYYPVDFETINKGDSFPPEELERITGTTAGTTAYDFAVLGFRSQLIKECAARGKHVSVASVNGVLRVLKDDEAAKYEADQFKLGLRKSGRAFHRLVHVNQNALTDDQRKGHERNIIVFAKQLQAMREAKKIAMKPHKRTTPAISQTVTDDQ